MIQLFSWLLHVTLGLGNLKLLYVSSKHPRRHPSGVADKVHGVWMYMA